MSKRIFRNDAEKHKYELLRYQILKIIHDKIKEHIIINPDKLDTLSRFVNSCSERSGSRIISFNYDLLLESTGSWITYGVTNSYPATTIQERGGYPVEITKLHGSFNWYRAKGTVEQDMHYIYRVDELDDEYCIHQDDVPVFIPMAHTKDSFLNGSLFNTLWAKASHILKSSEEIYFLGYSFPETDLSNLFYFLDFKDSIKKIVIYDAEESPSFVRLQTIFGPDKVVRCDACEFLTTNLDEWESERDAN